MRFLLVVLCLLAIDFYSFKGVRLLTSGWTTGNARLIVHTAYWAVSIALIAGMVIVGTVYARKSGVPDYRYFFFMFGAALIVMVPKLVFTVFHLLEDLSYVVVRLFKSSGGNSGEGGGAAISRFRFITQVGLVAAAIPFGALTYGILRGRWRFQVFRETLAFDNLPPAFDGLKVVQISDLHLGSFFNRNHEEVARGIQMINDLEPDLILFTGDLVNNYAEEAEAWVDHFAGLKARIGKFSILGNHDYGDYVRWPGEEAKQANVEAVIAANRRMGFRVLLNENETIEVNGEKIGLVGVENWGARGFTKYGDLDKAVAGSEQLPFRILLSHDPSHWDAQVLRHTNIDLTLSGHTHGMQFGVEVGNWKISPVQMVYPRWAGLYTEGQQHLYVNRGFGYIGYPGRVGISPEITLLELRSRSAKCFP
ncbi:MAG: metallophosphoesterase, partial [Bacteroidota bacterium]